jgi:hypothetical protein
MQRPKRKSDPYRCGIGRSKTSLTAKPTMGEVNLLNDDRRAVRARRSRTSWTLSGYATTARGGMTTFSDNRRQARNAARGMRGVRPEGQYRLIRLMKELGPEATLWGFVETVTANCEPRRKKDLHDPCRAVCPDLSKVLMQRRR